jgi:PhnB protein
MQLNPYLVFDGQCEAAFRFYENCLGGKIEALVPFEGSPVAGQVPAELATKILHARLVVGDQILMGSDAPPGRYEAPKGISVSIGIDDAAAAERIFNALAEGGTVQMPMEQTFWALRFGMVVDRFGIPWMVNCEGPQQR